MIAPIVDERKEKVLVFIRKMIDQGYTVPQIATSLGCSEDKAKQAIEQAKSSDR